MLGRLVEERVPDVFGFQSALGVPVRLERKSAQDVVDELTHPPDAPAGPGPQLRRQVIEHGNPGRLRFAGDPPVEAGKIDKHDGVGPISPKDSLRPADEAVKRPQQGMHFKDADHRQVGQIAIEIGSPPRSIWGPP